MNWEILLSSISTSPKNNAFLCESSAYFPCPVEAVEMMVKPSASIHSYSFRFRVVLQMLVLILYVTFLLLICHRLFSVHSNTETLEGISEFPNILVQYGRLIPATGDRAGVPKHILVIYVINFGKTK